MCVCIFDRKMDVNQYESQLMITVKYMMNILMNHDGDEIRYCYSIYALYRFIVTMIFRITHGVHGVNPPLPRLRWRICTA